MHILIAPTGSYGDVYPFVGLARVLKSRGHDVVFCANDYFRHAAQAEELQFVAMGGAELYREVVADPELWHPTRGARVIFGMIARYVPLSYQALMQHYRPGETLLVGSTLAFGARLVQEKHQGRMVSVHLAPNVFRSDEETIHLPTGTISPRVPRWIRNGFWWLIDRLAIDPLIAPALNDFRAHIGLRPVQRVFKDWIHSPDCVIGLFPEWFARRRKGWPAQVRLTGFPLYDAAEHEPLSGELLRFLDAGAPPVLFAPGTANAVAGNFFAASLAACERAGRRALFVSRFGSQLPGDLPEWAQHYDYLPFSEVLPRCSAFVSHGGIGSVSQGFRAGVPQLVRPMGFDQFENGFRASRLGVAQVLTVKRYQPDAIVTALEALATASCAAACRSVAARFDGRPALEEAADIVEQLNGRD